MEPTVSQESAPTCPSQGLAGRLQPEVAAGLGAISRVARALTGPGALTEVATRALDEMRAALDLETAVLYVPDSDGRPVLRRFLHSADTDPAARPELVFDEEAWRLAVAGGHPLVFHDAAGWLVDNPFEPAARFWFALPLGAAGELVGVVVAARATPVLLDPTTLTVLMLLGDQLSAGIATARLRQELQRSELERERMRLAAEVHDGLAQDLALAMRELAFLAEDPPRAQAEESRRRLTEAVAAAHRLVRARLVDLSASPPLGGLAPAVRDVCGEFCRHGLDVDLDCPPEHLEASPEQAAAAIRILREALTNADRHAEASRVEVRLERRRGALELAIADDGHGFDPSARVAEGHLGLELMRRRAQEAGGELSLTTRPGGGTTVALRLP
ncbi:MAG TPA: GAF domain-containing sensor histidine kinase [Thermoleophilaceae bacterium]